MLHKTLKTLLATAVVITFGMTSAFADPVKERKEAMKQVKGAMKVVVPMLKGETDYNAKGAADAMQSMANAGKTFATKFPEDTDMHPDTTAKATIWENMDDFQAKVGEFVKAASGAQAAAAGGKASFAGAFGAVGKTCKGCHEKYRVKKN